jgi:hypothetical protein
MAVAADIKKYEPPPLDQVLNLYDIEEIAHASMRDTSWGYYATGSMDEFTKCASAQLFNAFLGLSNVFAASNRHSSHR